MLPRRAMFWLTIQTTSAPTCSRTSSIDSTQPTSSFSTIRLSSSLHFTTPISRSKTAALITESASTASSVTYLAPLTPLSERFLRSGRTGTLAMGQVSILCKSKFYREVSNYSRSVASSAIALAVCSLTKTKRL